mmetsp:Transcript_11969/g.25909  ORF Transcript_11969/g.25909 Transcript_11969/m.25909 type:complete len:751 (-) Transcript_11969:103-2355(-)
MTTPPSLLLILLACAGAALSFTADTCSHAPRFSRTHLWSTTTTEDATSSSSSPDASSSSSSSPKREQKNVAGTWFPVRPPDALPTEYNAVVRGAYVRHVLLETEAMADAGMAAYLKGGMMSSFGRTSQPSEGGASSDVDPFGALARDLSACDQSRHEGGKIGWVDNPTYRSGNEEVKASSDTDASLLNEAVRGLLPPDIIAKIFQSRPKGGDVLKLSSEETEMWHLVRIDDIHVDYQPDSSTSAAARVGEGVDTTSSTSDFVNQAMGTNKVITSRAKLKGLGILPVSPKIVRPGSSSDDSVESADARSIAKTYHIATTGCQMNVADSERLAGVLENNLRLKATDASSDADVVVLNTCTIRDHAEQKVYDALGPHAARKRRGEAVAIVVAGCVAQQEGEALLRRVPEVDVVMGPQYTGRLGDLLEGVGRGHQIVATDPTLISEDMSQPVRGHATRAWVNVIHGCNEHCTYCVVPGVRGVEQSRSMESILQECLDLAEAGFKEITLLGQNIDAYGRDMMPKRTFADLLHYLNKNIPEGTIERVRYVTSHPRYFSDRVIDAVAELDKICECFHMPFQAGDDTVLRNMRRGYTFDSYMKIINKIRAKAPDASICGDVIVGFPGESDEAFERTLDLMRKVKFDNLNTFAYSQRPNTEAAQWGDQISDEVKSERLQKVQRLATAHALERSQRYVGKAVEVLVEERNPRNMEQVMGRTRQGRQVFFDGEIDELMGSLVDVEIVEARPWSLTGKIIGR